jgi:hypothetical protein
LIKIISVIKAIESYEYFLDHIIDPLTQEVEEDLQLYFIFLCIKQTSAFSV